MTTLLTRIIPVPVVVNSSSASSDADGTIILATLLAICAIGLLLLIVGYGIAMIRAKRKDTRYFWEEVKYQAERESLELIILMGWISTSIAGGIIAVATLACFFISLMK